MPSHIVKVETIRSIITVGVSASKLLATDGGTCSGILILNPDFCVNLKISTAKKAEIIPTNIPSEPIYDMPICHPLGTAFI